MMVPKIEASRVGKIIEVIPGARPGTGRIKVCGKVASRFKWNSKENRWTVTFLEGLDGWGAQTLELLGTLDQVVLVTLKVCFEGRDVHFRPSRRR